MISCRVLDLTNEQGYLCGKILADFGAEVIKIEKPGGDPGRKRGPFYKDVPHPEKSLFWFAFNIGKKSITLDITKDEGKEMLQMLIRQSDIIVESFHPGYMDKLGLGYTELSKLNPGVIMVSITPFGSDGPYKDYKTCDLIVMALSGFLYITGDTDRPPVRITFPQSFLHAATDGATGALLALYHREICGEGQCVDVSAQQCVSWAMRESRQAWEQLGKLITRQGAGVLRPASGAYQRYVWQCKNGFISFAVLGKQAAGGMAPLIKWMAEEGVTDGFVMNINWEEFDFGNVSPEDEDHIESVIGEFFKKHTKEELLKRAMTDGILLLPVSTVEDIVNNPQLSFRGYWEDVEHPELGTLIRYPGICYNASGLPPKSRMRPPLIGEHNEEIYAKELRIPLDELRVLEQKGII